MSSELACTFALWVGLELVTKLHGLCEGAVDFDVVSIDSKHLVGWIGLEVQEGGFFRREQ